ncbi:MAG: hypothetical protein GVY27_05975 [Deinococcus-Thermus bacterium]|nr:hypothetical protein [Deinococcota bacterium]
MATFWIYGLTLAVPALVILGVAVQNVATPAVFLLDPLTVAEHLAPCCRPYFGAISNLGVILWALTAGCCLLAGVVCLRRAGPRDRPAFFFAALLLTSMLMLDDAYLFHEKIFPNMLAIPQTWVIIGYGVAAAAYLVGFARTILAHRWPLMALSLTFFAASLGVDQLTPQGATPNFVAEDGFKFAGICSWLAFHADAAIETLANGGTVQR